MPRLAWIYRTDTHTCDRSPVSWKADYPSEIWSNLEQIGKFAREHHANGILDGGDFFHVKSASRNPHSLVIKTNKIHSAYPCPTWEVEGNHDVKYNNLETIDEQPLGVLFSSGIFHQLREQVFTDGDLVVRVVGMPYSPFRTLADLKAIKKKPGDTFLICIVHQLASGDPPKMVEDFFGEPVFRYSDLIGEDGPDVWCFPPETPVIDWLYRPIPIGTVAENVVVAGRAGPTVVEAVHPVRQVSEDLVRLDIEGVPPFVPGVTAEHPYWVAKNLRCVLPSRSTRRCHPDKPHTSYPCAVCTQAPEVHTEWVAASQIEVGDYVAVPVPRIPSDASSSPGLARLLGYYASEGHIILNRDKLPVAGVAWSFHEAEEDMHDDVRDLVKEHFGLDTHEHPTTGRGIQVCAYGREIADFFAEHGGRYSYRKSLSSWIWQQSAVARTEFLIGWMLGDGHARSSKTEVMGATVSQALAWQAFFLALSVGLRPFFTVRQPQDETRFPCNVVSFYGDDAEALSRRLGVTPPERSKTKVAGFFADGLYFARVREVSRWHYEGPVHNFRTSSGEYVAGGVLVHNCFGHWHKDQGIVNIGETQFVNLGAVSRGALIRENTMRTPKVALIEATKERIRVMQIPLIVAPAEDVFDLEKKERQEKEETNIEAFVQVLQANAAFDPAASIDHNLNQMNFAAEVRDLAREYLEKARAGVG